MKIFLIVVGIAIISLILVCILKNEDINVKWQSVGKMVLIIILLILISSLVANVIEVVPDSHGDFGDWLGFWGNIISGVLGAIVAAIVSYYVTTSTYLQMEVNKLITQDTFKRNKTIESDLITNNLVSNKSHFKKVLNDVNKLEEIKKKYQSSSNVTVKDYKYFISQIEKTYHSLMIETKLISDIVHDIEKVISDNGVVISEPLLNLMQKLAKFSYNSLQEYLPFQVNAIKFSEQMSVNKVEKMTKASSNLPKFDINHEDEYFDDIDNCFVDSFKKYMDEKVIPNINSKVKLEDAKELWFQFQTLVSYSKKAERDGSNTTYAEQ